MKIRAIIGIVVFLLAVTTIPAKPLQIIYIGDDTFATDEFLGKFGQIQTWSGKRLGAGFIAGKGNEVFTVAHAALQDSMRFRPFKGDTTFGIRLKYKITSLDLAVYSRMLGEFPKGYDLGDFTKVRPGDSIVYYGWVKHNRIREGQTVVLSSGITRHGTENLEFIEFEGHGEPGYSGGPVFNIDGEVIAIIRSIYDMVNPKTGKKFRIIRAVSINFLRLVEKDLETYLDN